MEYFGKVAAVVPRSGTTRDGKEWVAHQVEMRPVNGGARLGLVADVGGAERWERLTARGLTVGAVGTLRFEVSVAEWNGRKYNQFFVTGFKPYEVSAAVGDGAAAGGEAAAGGDAGEAGDLPF